jgi:hypothetical protein
MLRQWLWIMLSYEVNVVMNYGVLCWTSGSESWWGMLSQWFVNHGMLWWASDCDSWCAMLSQWLRITVLYAEPLVVNHGVFCCANGCESWCVMLSQWLWIMVCLLCCVSGCESCCALLSHWVEITVWMLCQWVWIMVSNAEPVVVIHTSVRITHHESHLLAQNNTPWFTTTGSA